MFRRRHAPHAVVIPFSARESVIAPQFFSHQPQQPIAVRIPQIPHAHQRRIALPATVAVAQPPPESPRRPPVTDRSLPLPAPFAVPAPTRTTVFGSTSFNIPPQAQRPIATPSGLAGVTSSKVPSPRFL